MVEILRQPPMGYGGNVSDGPLFRQFSGQPGIGIRMFEIAQSLLPNIDDHEDLLTVMPRTTCQGGGEGKQLDAASGPGSASGSHGW